MLLNNSSENECNTANVLNNHTCSDIVTISEVKLQSSKNMNKMNRNWINALTRHASCAIQGKGMSVCMIDGDTLPSANCCDTNPDRYVAGTAQCVLSKLKLL